MQAEYKNNLDNNDGFRLPNTPNDWLAVETKSKKPFLNLIVMALILAMIFGLLYKLTLPRKDILFFIQCIITVVCFLVSVWYIFWGSFKTITKKRKLVFFTSLFIVLCFNAYTAFSYVNNLRQDAMIVRSRYTQHLRHFVSLTEPTGTQMVTYETDRFVFTFGWDDVEAYLKKENRSIQQDEKQLVFRDRIEEGDERRGIVSMLVSKGKYKLFDKNKNAYVNKVWKGLHGYCTWECIDMVPYYALPDGTIFFEGGPFY